MHINCIEIIVKKKWEMWDWPEISFDQQVFLHRQNTCAFLLKPKHIINETLENLFAFITFNSQPWGSSEEAENGIHDRKKVVFLVGTNILEWRRKALGKRKSISKVSSIYFS